MATYTAKIRYCSGSTQSIIFATLTVQDTCKETAFYSQGECNFRDFRKTVSVSIPHTLPFDLELTFTGTWEITWDYDTNTTQNGTFVDLIRIPAGQTSVTYVSYDGGNFLCRRETYCPAGEGGVMTMV